MLYLRLFLIALTSAFVLGPMANFGRASCGDYATRKNAMENNLASGSFHQYSDGLPSQHQPANPHEPCTGPWCSQRSIPPLIPPSSSNTEIDQYAWELANRITCPSEPIPATSCMARLRPIRLTTKVFHPPRAVS